MQSPPFRKAIQTDPYFKRLSSSKKQNFWKIFKGIPHSDEFKELMEKVLTKYPNQRYGLDQIRGSKFFDVADDNDPGIHGQGYSPESFLEEIKHRFDTVESAKENDFSNKTNHEQNSCYYSETEVDEDLQNKENLEFQEARIGYISKIEDLSRILKHQHNLQKIKKECMKNMIAGPSLIEYSGPNSV